MQRRTFIQAVAAAFTAPAIGLAFDKNGWRSSREFVAVAAREEMLCPHCFGYGVVGPHEERFGKIVANGLQWA